MPDPVWGALEVEKRCERTSGAQGQRENERCGAAAVAQYG